MDAYEYFLSIAHGDPYDAQHHRNVADSINKYKKVTALAKG